MNVQTHMSGQISGQVPNQAGSQMPVLSQHNGNALPPQMQNLGGPARAMSNMDPELMRARQIVQDRICQIIQQRQLPQPMNDRTFWRIVNKLDEGLLKSSRDKDDYMNLETLESRLHNLIKRPPNQSQQYQQAVNASQPEPSQIQVESEDLGGPARAMSNMDPELMRARQIVQDRICQIIQQRQLPQPMNDRTFWEIVNKLDEGLLKSARDKDDYMNPETLESRLHNLIKRPPNQSQQYQQAVNSSQPEPSQIQVESEVQPELLRAMSAITLRQ